MAVAGVGAGMNSQNGTSVDSGVIGHRVRKSVPFKYIG